MSHLLKKLAELNNKIRSESTCPVCGLPREGIRNSLGGRWITTYDETGSECQQNIGGHPESYKDAGLCLCERAYFYSVATGHKLCEHWAQGGIFRGFEPSRGEGVTALYLVIEAGELPQRVTAADFGEPVHAEILAPDQSPETIRFDLVGFTKAQAVA